METSWGALERAGIAPDSLKETLTGVYIGVSATDYYAFFLKDTNPQDTNDHIATGNALSAVSGRLSYFLGLQGPSLSIDTACSSSIVALHEACMHLRAGECHLAIAGGVNVTLLPEVTSYYSREHLLAPDGRCKSFDAKADGYVRGEGCGILILKRLSDALKAGDPILALIRGSLVNQGGSSSGLTVPNRSAQEKLLQTALTKSKITPDAIQFIEAHGTGTSLGDAIEMGAIVDVYGKGRTLDNPLIVGSVKTNIGHLESASGAAGIIKTVLALQHQTIPKNLHFTELNPKIRLKDYPIKIPTDHIPWTEGPRSAGVSAFGFTGTNAHMILEEGVLQKSHVELSHYLITLSAKTEEGLQSRIRQFTQYVESHPELPLGELAIKANCRTRHEAYRVYLVAASRQELLVKLQGGDYKTAHSPAKLPKLAFLFTGQGAQYPRMGKQLYETQKVFKEALDRCANVLDNLLEKPFLTILFNEDRTELDQTGYTQPILFAFEYALTELWKSWGIIPDFVMGHSAGEYAAAAVAGIISLEDGLKLIAARARLMQSLPAGGAMGALEVDLEQLTRAIAQHAPDVDIGAINGPKQTVIAGKEDDVMKILEFFKGQNAKVHRLFVSHASHSKLMDPMLDPFLKITQTVTYRTPSVAVISNLTGKRIGQDSIAADYWTKHIRSPVLFYNSMQTLKAENCELFLEAGPHPVLVRIGRECYPENRGTWLPSLIRERDEWKTILESLGELYLKGAQIDFSNFESALYKQDPTVPKVRTKHLITLSAKTEPALVELVQKYQNFIQSHPELLLSDVAYTANVCRSHFNCRLAVIAKDTSELLDKLQKQDYLSGTVTGYISQKVSIHFEKQGQYRIDQSNGSDHRVYITPDTPWETLLSTLAEYYVQGADIDWVEFHRPYYPQKIILPTYAFQRERYWKKQVSRDKKGVQLTIQKPPEISVEVESKVIPIMQNVMEPSNVLAKLATANPNEREKIVYAYVEQLVKSILGIPTEKLLGPSQGFFELGMNSLMAMNFTERLQEDLETIELSPTIAFDFPTLSTMTKHILAQYAPTPVGNIEKKPKEEMKKQVKSLMTDEEIMQQIEESYKSSKNI